MLITCRYTTDDPANPQNWSPRKKFFVAFLIDLYTFVIYCGSSIYVSSEVLVMIRFGVGDTKAALGLALYVLSYGIGPLIWAPMSEIPTFGRNVPYVVTFALYVILCVPTALVDNLGGLLFLRFLQGFFGSPCLANGGASMGVRPLVSGHIFRAKLTFVGYVFFALLAIPSCDVGICCICRTSAWSSVIRVFRCCREVELSSPPVIAGS
jgi:MFS family permease